MRQREDLMEVRHRQQFESTGFAPRLLGLHLTLRTMAVAATVIHKPLEAAAATPLAMAAQSLRSTSHNPPHHLAMTRLDTMTLQVVSAVMGEDVGQLETWLLRRCRVRRRVRHAGLLRAVFFGRHVLLLWHPQ